MQTKDPLRVVMIGHTDPGIRGKGFRASEPHPFRRMGGHLNHGVAMYRKILVPLDGSPFAEAALPLAKALVKSRGGELHLTTVVAPLPAVRPGSGDGEGPVKGWFEEERSRGTRYLKNVVERLEKEGVSAPLHTRVLTGPVVPSLQERIEKIGADLVVMTTHGRGRLAQMWLGSVADGLIRSGPCPILLWRPEDEEQRPPLEVKRILVPLDGSDDSASVVPHARELAHRMEARLYLLSVVDHGIHLGSTYMPHAAQEEEEREKALEELRAHLEEVAVECRSDGLQVDTRVQLNESPARAILEHQEEVGADLIAMSTRGRGGVARLVMGSVADKVIRGGTVPVFVNRPGD